MNKPFSFITAMFLWVVAVVHVARLIFHVPVTVGDVHVPMWLSIFPIIVLPVIAVMLRKEAR